MDTPPEVPVNGSQDKQRCLLIQQQMVSSVIDFRGGILLQNCSYIAVEPSISQDKTMDLEILLCLLFKQDGKVGKIGYFSDMMGHLRLSFIYYQQ